MYTEIQVDILYFNEDTKENSAICQNAKKHKVHTVKIRI